MDPATPKGLQRSFFWFAGKLKNRPLLLDAVYMHISDSSHSQQLLRLSFEKGAGLKTNVA
jgi:hypothetical protein